MHKRRRRPGALSGWRVAGCRPGGLPLTRRWRGGAAEGHFQGDMGERRGDAGGWARVKSGFIFPILSDYPEGPTPAEMRPLLGVDKSLADTGLGMLRYGMLRKIGPGRYVVAQTREE